MIKKTLTCLLLSIVLLSLNGCSPRSLSALAAKPQDNAKANPRDAESLALEAYRLLEKDLPAALVMAKQAVALDPNLAEAQKNLALAYYEAGRADEALAPAKEAVRLAPAYNKAHYVLGKTLAAVGRPDEAITELKAAIRLKPDYDKAHYMMGLIYDRLGDTTQAESHFNEAARIDPTSLYFRVIRDSLHEYLRIQQQPLATVNIPFDVKKFEYSNGLYSGIVSESLLHQNFELLEKMAEEARSSKQILPGGRWLLQTVYAGLEAPYESRSASEYKWNSHLSLLKNWVERKPDSVTAKIALGATYVAYGWHARGNSFARDVAPDRMQVFMERIAEAKRILNSVLPAQRSCPHWYSVMQQIAIAEGWSEEDYAQLFNEAVTLEPSWYSFYRSKAFYLLPRWHGEDGDVARLMNSLQTQPGGQDGLLLAFLVSEAVGPYDNNRILFRQEKLATQLKQGFLQLQKRHGTTAADLNWACFIAVGSNDKPFARELLNQIKEDWDRLVWSKEEFDSAKKWANEE